MMNRGVRLRRVLPTSEIQAEPPELTAEREQGNGTSLRTTGLWNGSADFNPFTDPLGVLYVLGFAAVALSAYRTGMNGVIGVLPLWAVAASVAAAGCVLVHWAKWGAPEVICPAAVVWALQALWLEIVDVLADHAPSLARVTPVADPVIVQWSIPVVTVGLGAWAVLLNFKMILKNHQTASTVMGDHVQLHNSLPTQVK